MLWRPYRCPKRLPLQRRKYVANLAHHPLVLYAHNTEERGEEDEKIVSGDPTTTKIPLLLYPSLTIDSQLHIDCVFHILGDCHTL